MWDKIKDGAKGLADKSIESAKEKREQKKLEEREFKDRIKQMDKDGIAYCPKCYSTDLSVNKRGYTFTTGIIGMNKLKVTCLKCGNKFKPGK